MYQEATWEYLEVKERLNQETGSLGFRRPGIQYRNGSKGSSRELLSNQPRLKQEVRELWVEEGKGSWGGGVANVKMFLSNNNDNINSSIDTTDVMAHMKILISTNKSRQIKQRQ